jgi:hypothetical protein
MVLMAKSPTTPAGFTTREITRQQGERGQSHQRFAVTAETSHGQLSSLAKCVAAAMASASVMGEPPKPLFDAPAGRLLFPTDGRRLQIVSLIVDRDRLHLQREPLWMIQT